MNQPSIEESPSPASVSGRAVHNERFHAIDALRALAMFLGVVLHSSLGFMGEDVGFTPRMDRSRFVLFDLEVYAVHAFRMQLFFVVAGFFTALLLARRSPVEFVRGRLLRLGLPLVVGGAVIIPLTLWPFLHAKGVEPTAALLYAKPAHLWFLIYLSLFSAISWLMVEASGRWPRLTIAPATALLARCVSSPWALALMLVPTLALNMLMPSWVIETPWQWVPQPSTFAYYALFFATGWGVQRAGVVESIGRAWAWLLPIGLLVLFPLMIYVGGKTPASSAHEGVRTLADRVASMPAAIVQSLFTWAMILGLFGLFVRVCSGGRAWVRWLADSSYWVYLWHLPAVYWMAYALSRVEIPGLSAGTVEACVKFAMILGAVLAFTLGTYALLVRPTVLEKVVGGGGANKPNRPNGSGKAERS